MTDRYAHMPLDGDAARPYAVVAMFRTFNRVVGRYETRAQAARRARELNNRKED